jgi:hypothetical protein
MAALGPESIGDLPTLSFDRELSLYQDDREVRVFSNGAGRTRGDAVVYLPAEKIVIAGDLLSTPSFTSTSYPRAWLARLDEIAALDWKLFVPGHGSLQKDRTSLELHRELLRSLAEQVDRCVREGASLEETVAKVDLSRFKEAHSREDPRVAAELDERVSGNAPRDAYLEATSARASRLGEAVKAEASRLASLVPEARRTGMLANDLKAAVDALAQIPRDVSSGRIWLAFRTLALNQDMAASAAFWYDHEEVLKPPSGFEALWEQTGPELEIGDLAKSLEGKSAAVRARAEIAMNRIEPHYSAARLYAKAAQNAGGLFYLGSALSGLALVRFCSTLPDDAEGDPPDFDFSGLAVLEAELSRRALDRYQGEAPIEHHQDFIRLDSALKEARELLQEGRLYGAAASLLEARLRLGVVTAPAGAVPHFDSVTYEARLFDPRRDHSLARELWERALAGASSTDEDERRLAAVILEDVIPFYFDRLSR